MGEVLVRTDGWKWSSVVAMSGIRIVVIKPGGGLYRPPGLLSLQTSESAAILRLVKRQSAKYQIPNTKCLRL